MFINPYRDIDMQGSCQRSSFHTHAGTGPGTCGAYDIDEVLEVYKELEYGGICISNHNLYTDPAPYAKHDICLIGGYEYTKEIHIVCAGTDKVCLDSHQSAIDSCTGDGGFTILCHPNYKKEWWLSKETIDSLSGYIGIEIYNGSLDCGKVLYGQSKGRCNASNVYDYILSGGKLKWCFGNDDFHRWWMIAITWNMVFADRNTDDMIEAVKQGRFYVSTGLLLEYLTLCDDRINISVRNNEGYRDIYQYRFIGKNGYIYKEVVSENASYELKGDEMYIRVEVISSSGKMLYAQPVYDETVFSING